MRFRVTYSAAGFADFVATPPAGWDGASIGFERDPKLLSLVEFFESSFATYGPNGQPVQFDIARTIDGGRDQILAIEATNGCDSKIRQLVEIDENDDDAWETFFDCVLSIDEFVESMSNSHLLQIASANSDFWTKFTSRFNTKVDLESVLDLDGNAIVATQSFNLPLPSQILRSGFSGGLSFNGPGYPLSFLSDGFDFGILNFDLVTLDEIDSYNQSIPFTTADTPEFSYLFAFKYKGGYTFDIKITGQVTVGVDILGNFFDVILIVGTNAITLTKVNTVVGLINITTYTYSGTIAVNAGDLMQLYFSAITPGTRRNALLYGDTTKTFLQISADTVAPDSNTDAFLTYDIIKGIIKRICGAPFKSDYFGNPYTSDAYVDVGCGSEFMHMLGLHLRGYLTTDKPFQASAQDWFDWTNPRHCIGMGYEKIAGVDTIVAERAEHFFDDSNVSVDFLNIYDIKRSYDQDWQFNKLTFGCQKWESAEKNGVGAPSGIDDPQSQRTWTSRFQFIGKELSQLAKCILASITIETTRRISLLESANYTFDNDVFGIDVKPIGAPNYVPKTDDDFSSVTNLLNAHSRYNIGETPARFLLRWAKYWSGCLQDYVGSAIKYAAGVGNFLMTTTKTTSCDGDDTGNVVAENGDFVVGNDYLFIPTPLEINHKLDWTTYKYLRDHKNWAVTISQTGVVGTKAFVKSLKYYKAKGIVKMIVWPKTKFTIQQIESIATGEDAIPGIKYFQIPEFSDEFE